MTDPAKRMSATEALAHRWMRKHYVVACPQADTRLRFRAVVTAVRAMQRLQLLEHQRRLKTGLQVCSWYPQPLSCAPEVHSWSMGAGPPPHISVTGR